MSIGASLFPINSKSEQIRKVRNQNCLMKAILLRANNLIILSVTSLESWSSILLFIWQHVYQLKCFVAVDEKVEGSSARLLVSCKLNHFS